MASLASLNPFADLADDTKKNKGKKQQSMHEMNNNKNKPVVLCIMDGWGINQSSDFNAVALAKTPNVDYFSKIYPYSTLDASGEHVGLPKGQVGNSEVGHMNLGSGRVILQTLPKINKAFANNEINNNENFQKFLMKHNKNK